MTTPHALTTGVAFTRDNGLLQGGPPPGVGPVGPVEASLALVLGLVAGTTAIAVVARYLRDQPGIGTALVTALLGVLVVETVGWLVEPTTVAVVLRVVAWVAVVRFQYGGDWTDAAVLGGAAWAVAVVITALLSLVGLPVVGTPGV